MSFFLLWDAFGSESMHLCAHGAILKNTGADISGFEGARAPPQNASAPSRLQKDPLEMTAKLNETLFHTDIQLIYGVFDVNPRPTGVFL